MKQGCHIYIGVRASVEEVNSKLDANQRAAFWNGVSKILTGEQENHKIEPTHERSDGNGKTYP